jgi:predicted Fe-Mo cluster-binding NifX family protein
VVLSVKLSVTQWRGRVSPLFDTAQQFLLLELCGGEIIERRELNASGVPPFLKAEFLAGMGVQVLICGGISSFFYRQLLALGIQVIPWVAGEVEEVLQAYLHSRLPCKRYALPGCRTRRCRRRGSRR